MRDYLFYNYGCTEPKGFRRIVIPFRRLLRRLLRPMFQHQIELYRQLDADIDRLDADIDRLSQRQDRLDCQLKATMSSGWDHVAIVRRLAALEDHVEALMQRDAMAASSDGSPLAIEAPILKVEKAGNGEYPRVRDLDCAC
jgi:hypothetical protein